MLLGSLKRFTVLKQGVVGSLGTWCSRGQEGMDLAVVPKEHVTVVLSLEL